MDGWWRVFREHGWGDPKGHRFIFNFNLVKRQIYFSYEESSDSLLCYELVVVHAPWCLPSWSVGPHLLSAKEIFILGCQRIFYPSPLNWEAKSSVKTFHHFPCPEFISLSPNFSPFSHILLCFKYLVCHLPYFPVFPKGSKCVLFFFDSLRVLHSAWHMVGA